MIIRDENGKPKNSIRAIASRTYLEHIFIELRENTITVWKESIVLAIKGIGFLLIVPVAPLVIVVGAIYQVSRQREYMNREYPDGWRNK